VYKVRQPHALAIAKQKLSFLVASLSLFAFVMGNMVGQHGWYAFWKTVLGAEDDSMIAFVGTVPPIAKIPDYTLWAKYGGSKELHTLWVHLMMPMYSLLPLVRISWMRQ
jgi:hypothetical protein